MRESINTAIRLLEDVQDEIVRELDITDDMTLLFEMKQVTHALAELQYID